MGSEPRGGIDRLGFSENYSYHVKPGMENKPVIAVSFYSALRFCNWLHNGKGDYYSIEDGAYTMFAEQYPTNIITRNPWAKFWIPNDNEWYKAAYHQPSDSGGDVDSYWLYPTRCNTPPTDEAPPGGNSANFNHTGAGIPTDVGAFAQSPSYYGAFDQAGNLWEWTETWPGGGVARNFRGGSYMLPELYLRSSEYGNANPANGYVDVGFRVAALFGVQRIIDATSPGGTSRVDGVWYDTQLVIEKDLTLAGGTNAVIDAAFHGRTIFIGSNVTVNLRNLTIKNGRADGQTEDIDLYSGAGLYISKGATVTMENCIVENCGETNPADKDEYGGGIFNRGALTMNNCIIRNNRAWIAGGVDNRGTLSASDSLIVSNRQGGGVSGSRIHMNRCQVIGNSAPYVPGGMDLYGTNELNHCLLAWNSSGCSAGGGGIRNSGSLTLRTTSIVSNYAGGCTVFDIFWPFGGGLRTEQGTCTAYNGCVIADNIAEASEDYAAHDVWGPITLVNSNFVGIVSTNVTITQTVEISHVRQGFNATLTWPMTAYGNPFVVEARGVPITGSVWLKIEGPYATTNGNYVMPIDTDYGNRFFRLVSEP